jgi:hypothetical protein
MMTAPRASTSFRTISKQGVDRPDKPGHASSRNAQRNGKNPLVHRLAKTLKVTTIAP